MFHIHMRDYWHNLMACLENHPYPLDKCYFCKKKIVFLKSIGFYGKDTLGRCPDGECEISNNYHVVFDEDNKLKQISFMMGNYLFCYGVDEIMILLMTGSEHFKIKSNKFQFVTHKNLHKIEEKINKLKILS